MVTVIVMLAILYVIVKVAYRPTDASRKADAEFAEFEARYARGWRD